MTRLTLDLNDEVCAELDKTALTVNAADKIEVVRRALALYTFVTNNALVGSELYLRHADGTEQQVVVR